MLINEYFPTQVWIKEPWPCSSLCWLWIGARTDRMKTPSSGSRRGACSRDQGWIRLLLCFSPHHWPNSKRWMPILCEILWVSWSDHLLISINRLMGSRDHVSVGRKTTKHRVFRFAYHSLWFELKPIRMHAHRAQIWNGRFCTPVRILDHG